MPDDPRPSGAGTSRSTSATIQPNILRYLALVTEERGADLKPALEQVGLDEVAMRSVDLRVSYRQGSSVIRRALDLTGDEHLGMSVGAAQHLTAWGLLGLALMASDTLADAIETGITTPFGGWKQSGFGGAEKSLAAFDQWTLPKVTWLRTRSGRV